LNYGLSIRNAQRHTLNKFQKTALELDRILDSRLHVTRFSQYLSERADVHDRTIRRWIQSSHYHPPESLVQLVLDVIGTIRKGEGNQLKDMLSAKLVPISDFPSLEECVEKLYFRSYKAMCEAIRDETGISASTIMMYMYRPKQKYGRIEIRGCLIVWLEKHGRGEDLGVNPTYRGVGKMEILSIVRFLVEVGVYETKVDLAREVANKKGLNPLTVETKYFGENSHTKYVPIAVYEFLKGLFKIYDPKKAYSKGDILYNPFARDFGIVEEAADKHMIVNWRDMGQKIMAHNEPHVR